MSIPCQHNPAYWYRWMLWLLIAAGAVWIACTVFAPAADKPTDSIFDLSRLHGQYIQLQQTIAQLFAQGQYAEAESRCHDAIQLFPGDALSYYNLACALSRQGKTAEAVANLATAIAFGFNHDRLMQADPDLETVRGHEEFGQLLEAARVAAPQPWQQHVTPGVVHDGRALVSETNTAYHPHSGTFLTFFTFPGSQGAPHATLDRDMAMEA
ncbi:MAG TPA: tetratricopeptide repeat protein [Candidatus Tectomicrobia bacterium]